MGMPTEPIPLKLNDANLQRLIREAAADTARVYFPKHATQRMRERAITPTQVYECLRRGSVSEPAHMNLHGNWQCTLKCVMQVTTSRSPRHSSVTKMGIGS
jgi:hypothetical protein